jgi:hypothetical protein
MFHAICQQKHVAFDVQQMVVLQSFALEKVPRFLSFSILLQIGQLLGQAAFEALDGRQSRGLVQFVNAINVAVWIYVFSFQQLHHFGLVFFWMICVRPSAQVLKVGRVFADFHPLAQAALHKLVTVEQLHGGIVFAASSSTLVAFERPTERFVVFHVVRNDVHSSAAFGQFSQE